MNGPAKAVWLFRFGKHLMAPQPSRSATSAARESVKACREEPDTWPERAAERVASTPQTVA
jgi:hypothetical protein